MRASLPVPPDLHFWSEHELGGTCPARTINRRQGRSLSGRFAFPCLSILVIRMTYDLGLELQQVGSLVTEVDHSEIDVRRSRLGLGGECGPRELQDRWSRRPEMARPRSSVQGPRRLGSLVRPVGLASRGGAANR